MKKALLALAAAVLLAGSTPAFAQGYGPGGGYGPGYGMGPGMMGGYGGGYGPGYGMGPGMMRGYGGGYGPGYGMGPGMMWGYGGGYGPHGGYGPGYYGMGPGMMWGYGEEGPRGSWSPREPGNYPGGPQFGPQALDKPLTREQAEAMVQSQLERLGNPNLKVGKVTEKDGTISVEVVTKDNSLVEKFNFNRATGWVTRSFK